MKCKFYTKHGIMIESDAEINRSIFNNQDIIKAEFNYAGSHVTLLLNQDRRLIFYKEMTMNSPLTTTYCVGFQKTIKGRNSKSIIKMKPDGSMEMIE